MHTAKPETRPQLGEARGKLAAMLGPVAFVPLLKLSDIRFFDHRTCKQVREDRERAEFWRESEG